MTAVDDPRDQLPRLAARGAVSNYAGQIVVLAAAVLLTPVVLHHVGAVAFSLWVLANALTGYGGLLDLGIAAATQKYVAEHRARGEDRELSAYVTAALALFGGLGIAAFAVFAALSPFVAGLFGVDPRYAGTAAWLTLLVGAQVATALPGSLPTAILRGAQQFELANVVVIAGTLLNVVATLAALWLGGGIVAVAVAGVCSSALVQLPAAVLVHRTIPSLRIEPGGLSLERIRSIFSFSVGVFAFRVSDVATRRADPLVIGAALPVRLIAPYALAQRIPEAASILTNQVAQVFMPVASSLEAADHRRVLGSLFLGATRVSLAVALALDLSVGILGSSILAVWVGESYSAYGHLVAILAAASIVAALTGPAGAILTGIGRHRPLGWMTLGAAAAQIALSLALVFRFGLTGVAVGTLVPAVVETLGFVIPYSLRTMGVSMRTFVNEAIAPTVLPAGALAAVEIAASALLDTHRLGYLLATVAAGIAAFAAIYVPFSSSERERAFYRRLAAHALPQSWRPRPGG